MHLYFQLRKLRQSEREEGKERREGAGDLPLSAGSVPGALLALNASGTSEGTQVLHVSKECVGSSGDIRIPAPPWGLGLKLGGPWG